MLAIAGTSPEQEIGLYHKQNTNKRYNSQCKMIEIQRFLI